MDVLRFYVEKLKPTHIVLRMAHWRFIRYALNKGIKTFPIFANSFPKSPGIRGRIGLWLLAHYLNHPSITWVSNHQLNASQALVDNGVRAEKVIPYDWEHKLSPEAYAAKQPPSKTSPWKLFYCGCLSENKGLGDLLKAVAILNSRVEKVHLSVAGYGDSEPFQSLAHDLGIGDTVTFLGLIPNDTVINQMNAHDLVLVLSHHDCYEAFPMTLMEAMVARTPLIVSDHPIFLDKIIEGESGLRVPEKNPKAIANAIEWFKHHPSEYEQMSQTMLSVWQRLILQVKWADVIEKWLMDSEENRRWLQQHSLLNVLNP